MNKYTESFVKLFQGRWEVIRTRKRGNTSGVPSAAVPNVEFAGNGCITYCSVSRIRIAIGTVPEMFSRGSEYLPVPFRKYCPS